MPPSPPSAPEAMIPSGIPITSASDSPAIANAVVLQAADSAAFSTSPERLGRGQPPGQFPQHLKSPAVHRPAAPVHL